MSIEVTNADVLQAIMELSANQKEIAQRQDEMSTHLKEVSHEQTVIKEQLVNLSKDVNKKLYTISIKLDVMAKQLLDTQTEVEILKNAK